MTSGVVAVIPARIGSRRFPRKVLYPYRGRPLLYYVWREVCRSKLVDRTIIATDSPAIASAAKEFGAEVVRTSARHRTGSDRSAEVARKIRAGYYVNVQADNLGLKAAVLDGVLSKMKRDNNIAFATLVRQVRTEPELYDPNLVKVAVSGDGFALWFSRYPIPFLQRFDHEKRAKAFKFYGHVGVYFFRREWLVKFAQWRRSSLEKAESLEQLRILEHGGRIRVFETKRPTVSVDSPKDISKMDALIR
jgi:3-deoxy-manno-octulosonate cytidylyltransferase (CMP-KDO synthetase)